MSTSAFTWLHLTDFHYGLRGQPPLWSTLRGPFLESLKDLHKRTGPWNAVFFTGDLVQAGASVEYGEMQSEVLHDLWGLLENLGSDRAVFLAVPGNHDLFRPDATGDDAAIDALIRRGGFQEIAEKFWGMPGGSYRRAVTTAFAAYEEWWQKAPHRPTAGISLGALPGDFACTLDCDGRKVGIAGLNTTFLQLQGGPYEGRLVCDSRQLHQACDSAIDKWVERHDVRLLLTHQGPDWLTPESRTHFEDEVAPPGRFAVHLYGHMHETKLSYFRRGGSLKTTRLCQGLSAFGLERFGEPPKYERRHGYAVGRIEFGVRRHTFRLWPLRAVNKTGGWRFIPDHEYAELEPDGGTPPDSISVLKPPGKKVKNAKNKKASRPLETFVPVSTLPPRTVLFGRHRELEDIGNVLHPEHVGWGAVLHGPEGIGKTALAVEAAHRAPAEHFALKLFFSVKEGGFGPLRAAALFVDLGQALGRDDISRAPEDRRAAIIRSALKQHRALLVIDNTETLNVAERQKVYRFLAYLPTTSRAIVTARQPENACALNVGVRAADATALAELLDSVHSSNRRSLTLADADREALLKAAEGNALILTWIAKELGRHGSRHENAGSSIARLKELRLAAEKQKTEFCEVVLQDILQPLGQDEVKVLTVLSYFTAPIPMAWVTQLSGLAEDDAFKSVLRLVEGALVYEATVARAFGVPANTAAVLRRIVGNDVKAAADKRLVAWLAELAARSEAPGHGQPGFETVWPIFRAGLPLLSREPNELMQQVRRAVADFLDYSGRWDDWLVLNEAAEECAVAAGDWESAGWCAYDSGHIHVNRGHAEEVFKCADRAEQHWKRGGSKPQRIAIALNQRGQGERLSRNYRAAIAVQSEAVEIWRRSEPGSKNLAPALNSLSSSKLEAGDLEGAERGFAEALSIATKANQADWISIYTGNLVDVFLAKRDWSKAERMAQEALKLAEQSQQLELIASNHWRLAKSFLPRNRIAEASINCRKAVGLFNSLRHLDLAEARQTLAACEAAMSEAD